MELVAMFVIALAAAALVVLPLVRRAGQGPSPPAEVPPDREKEMALAAIRELEFDLATAKIAPEDYAALRARYELQAVRSRGRDGAPGVEAVRGMEVAPAAPGGVASPPADAKDLDARIEAAVRAARGRSFCASCGGALPPAARFCPACAAPVVKGTR